MKITRVPYSVVVLLAASCFYSYSNSVVAQETTGTTPNAAANGFTWNMYSVLPAQAGLTFNGLFYTYTANKETEDDFTVTIQNEFANGVGYVIQETDDWSGLPGATINKRLDLPNISQTVVGEGSIVTTGEGEVLDPSVVYSFRFDECFVPLSNPQCPGYQDALYQYLLDNGLLNSEPSLDDPFYDEWVQFQLNRDSEDNAEDDDEKRVREDTTDLDEDVGIEMLNAEVNIDEFVDGATQNAIITALSTIPRFELYTSATLDGGVYNDAVTLNDGILNDNNRALRQFATDKVHKDMVRSQYEN
jgi:hypothetical protein